MGVAHVEKLWQRLLVREEAWEIPYAARRPQPYYDVRDDVIVLPGNFTRHT